VQLAQLTVGGVGDVVQLSTDNAATGPPLVGLCSTFNQRSALVLPSLGHVMVAKWSTFWPIEDLGKSGYCYGWVNSRVICVAGVLQVGSLGETFLNLRSF
jgi:hypothetical protein